MEATVWIKIRARKWGISWHQSTTTASKSKPDTKDDEIAVKVIINIPDEVFEEPVYEARVTLPKTTRQFPEKAEVAKEVGEALTKKMGFKVRVEMPPDVEEVL